MKDTEKTPVILRTWRNGNKETFALFPTVPADGYGGLCTSYAHIGQHGQANYYYCIEKSRPAALDESLGLICELKRIGYNLQIIKRAPYSMHQQCRAAAQKGR